jgi:hypothetical protein
MLCGANISNGHDVLQLLEGSTNPILKMFSSEPDNVKYSLHMGYKKVGYLKQDAKNQGWSVFNATNKEVAKIDGDFSADLFTKTQKIFALKSLDGKKIGDLSVELVPYRDAKGEGQIQNLELTFNRCK